MVHVPKLTQRALQRLLGRNVLRLREEQGLSQEELAEASGLSVRNLQRLEVGEVNANLVTIVSLANALGVDPVVLLAPAPKRVKE